MQEEHIRLRIVTEEPGWILHRQAVEIASRLPEAAVNAPFPNANVHYYLNYGYFERRPRSGLVIANFTHYDPQHLADRWATAAREADHCVAVSEQTADILKRQGVSEQKISVILSGIDSHYKPKLTLGLAGRVYPGGRKGEALVHALIEDEDFMEGVQIVATSDDWSVPVWRFDDPADFYRSIDYLLIPSLNEGGPVPFMEALACGTLAIAPPVGVIPAYPHIPYERGNVKSLKKVTERLKREVTAGKGRLSSAISRTWQTWADDHIQLFDRLLRVQDAY